MALSDVLGEIGSGLEKGASATGRVAGALAPAIGKAVVNEEAGYAPQIAQENRQHAQAMEDQQINAKAGLLENQLKQLQSNAPLFNADGSVMTPQQRTQAISNLSGQFTQLYSHPRHAGTLMEKLRQAVSPGGMTAGGGQASPSPNTPATAIGGFTAAPPAGYQEQQDEAAQERQLTAQRDSAIQGINAWAAQLKTNGVPEAQINQARNEAIEKAMGATGMIVPKSPKLNIQGGIVLGGTDEHGRSFSLQDILAGNGGKDLQSQAQAYQKGEADKQAAADKKVKEAEDRQSQRESATNARQERSENFQQQMLGLREQEDAYKKLDETANQSQSLYDTYKAQYAQPGNHAATDTALIADYTTVLAKGGRKTQAELQMAREIGNFKLNAEQRLKKMYTGELPDKLRNMYLNYMKSTAQTEREEANKVKPNLSGIGGVARALNPVNSQSSPGKTPTNPNDPLGLF